MTALYKHSASNSLGSDRSLLDDSVCKSDSVVVDYDVPAVMRDGTVLRANIFRPGEPGRWSTVLVRTPYDKNVAQPDLDAAAWARRGFLLIVQDTRGRFASEGTWEPFHSEAQDGYDSVEWAAKLPHSNGLVGMFGASYCGNVQWLAARQRPPSLAAIAPTFTWRDAMDGLLARGGALELGLALFWALENGFDVVHRSSAGPTEVDRRIDALIREWDQLGVGGYWELPANDVNVLRRHKVPAFSGIRAIDDPYTGRISSVEHENIAVASLHTGGWYDIFLQGTLDNFTAINESNRHARLVIGPWSHELHRDPIGQLHFGLAASMNGAPVHQKRDWTGVQMDWFTENLTPASTPPRERDEPRVRVFVMGRNYWRDEAEWPPRRARRQKWFFTADGGLSVLGDAVDGTVEFDYDPTHPVPTVGGHGVAVNGFTAGPFDQAAVEARPDVVVFTSEALTSDLEVVGRIRAILYAQSSAPSTDWVARLCDVHPDGRSFNLCDGIVRIAQEADKLQCCEIDLWSTSNVFLRGHRLRVHVTSSSFPRWDRNLNTGDQLDAKLEVAHQRVCVGGRTSHIDLSVIDGERTCQ